MRFGEPPDAGAQCAVRGGLGDHAVGKAPPGQDLFEFQVWLVSTAEPFKGLGCSVAADERVSRLLLLK